jgi:hypothetical protein
VPIVDVLNPRVVSLGGASGASRNRVEMELEVGREPVVQAFTLDVPVTAMSATTSTV